ncbi:MAG: hypothetical protein FJ202_12955 [Gemmatimonadetes bacterium]|nr:hypothetical protein [Gemmatimonadota bacterium]
MAGLDETRRAALGRVAVVVLPIAPVVVLDGPSTVIGGAAKAVGLNLGLGILSGALCVFTFHIEGCFYALVTPARIVTDTAEAARHGMPSEEHRTTEAKLKRAVIVDRDRLVAFIDDERAKRQHPTAAPLPVPESRPGGEVVSYRGAARHDIDTVAEVTVIRVGLEKVVPGTKDRAPGIEGNIIDVDPHVRFVVDVSFRLVNAVDDTNIFQAKYSRHSWRASRWSEWMRDDASALSEARDETLRRLAQDIVTTTFGPTESTTSR